MSRRIVFVREGATTIAAALDDGVVDCLQVEHDGMRSQVGDLCTGRVSRVMPGMEAAFVEFGAPVAGFLHRADTPPGTTLQQGDKVLVQVSKDSFGDKGARLTMKPGLASRHLVWMPYGSGIAASARITDADEQARLTTALPATAGGVVIRTAAAGIDASTLQEELAGLQAEWADARAQSNAAAGDIVRPELAFEQRIVRDFGRAGDQVVAAGAVSDADRRVVLAAVHAALQPRVPLPSGGHLVIERTEAMTVVDVNTGTYVGRSGHAATVLQTNLEAAKVLARELRLRDVGGVIVVDFIDMQAPSDRDRVLGALRAAVANDAMRVHVGGISPLGLVEMTRKRTRRSLEQLLAAPCGHCDGRGTVVTN